jgi:hypothetical protein
MTDYGDKTVRLKCVKEAGKLRVRIISSGYYTNANCQFPRDIRCDGGLYRVRPEDIRLITTRGKFYYSIKANAVTVVTDYDSGGTVNAPTNVYEDVDTPDCCICMCVEKEIVFGCGHLYTCTSCSHRVSHCPICRQHITQRIHRSQFG